MTTLYDYWRSSASYRVRIALELLGMKWTAVPVDLATGAQRSAENRARNRQGLVPTIDVDGLTLTQSLAIIEYLDETRPEAGFLPLDAPGRARVRSLSYAVAMEIHPIANMRVSTHAAEQSKGAITVEGWIGHFLAEGLSNLDAMLADPGAGRFCHGDRVTMADICLVPQVYNARRWGVPLDDLPHIRRIDEELRRIPAIAAAAPENHVPA